MSVIVVAETITIIILVNPKCTCRSVRRRRDSTPTAIELRTLQQNVQQMQQNLQEINNV